MATTIETLKSYFKNGKKPTEQEFGELIDAFIHRDDDLQGFIGELAEISEAQEGIVNDKYMSPLLTKLAIYALSRLADIPELEAEVNAKDDRVKATLRDGIASGLDTLNKLHTALNNAITAHAALTNNPHTVTKAQVGLSNIPNAKSDSVSLSDSNTLASSKAVHDLRDQLSSLIGAHAGVTDNPHKVTKSQVGLGNLPNAKSDSVSLNASDTLATSKAIKHAYDKIPAWIGDQRDVLHVICAGKISSSGARVDYWGKARVNGFPFESERVGTGRYRIIHNWGSTSYGFVGSGIENPSIKASVYSRQTNECFVGVSDDDTLNTAAFSFIIFELI